MSNSKGWSFDVGAFMVLLGEDEEKQYRLMQRSIPECISAAPVAGLQSYLRSFSTFTELSKREYLAPYSRRSKQLRNLRLDRSITLRRCLKDGHFCGYRVTPNDTGKRSGRMLYLQWLWGVSTWLLVAAILGLTYVFGQMTWIGLSACAALVGWSIFIRLAESYCLKLKPHTEVSDKEKPDAMVLLGRRNSCFLLEGNRAEIERWVDWDITFEDGLSYTILDSFVQLGSLMLLLYIFITMPNGSTYDQIAFIGINTLGQLNVWLGQQLNSLRCLAAFDDTKNRKDDAAFRTNILGALIKKFGSGKWLDDLSILPATEETEVWRQWRQQVGESKQNSKNLWNEIRDNQLMERDMNAFHRNRPISAQRVIG